ncbi:MAG: hypothetical protein GY702_23215, partial [Desulfobulbaceae bacterium]|nr:hypothetical protein [Desulfobulbaceae bacterium]
MGEYGLHFVSKNAIVNDRLTDDDQDRPFASTPLNIDVVRPKTIVDGSPIFSDERNIVQLQKRLKIKFGNNRYSESTIHEREGRESDINNFFPIIITRHESDTDSDPDIDFAKRHFGNKARIEGPSKQQEETFSSVLADAGSDSEPCVYEVLEDERGAVGGAPTRKLERIDERRYRLNKRYSCNFFDNGSVSGGSNANTDHEGSVSDADLYEDVHRGYTAHINKDLLDIDDLAQKARDLKDQIDIVAENYDFLCTKVTEVEILDELADEARYHRYLADQRHLLTEAI